MSVDQMRFEIGRAYNSEKWLTRVAQMPDQQVRAIYFSFKRSGKLDPDYNKNMQKPKERYVQMTIWDYLRERGEEQ